MSCLLDTERASLRVFFCDFLKRNFGAIDRIHQACDLKLAVLFKNVNIIMIDIKILTYLTK